MSALRLFATAATTITTVRSRELDTYELTENKLPLCACARLRVTSDAVGGDGVVAEVPGAG